jgi:GxxExxY protein
MSQIEDNDILHKELCYKIYGLSFKIQNELGRYLNEKQYADSFEQRLKDNNISYEREVFLPKSFEGERDNRNKPDFIVKVVIIIDLKAKALITKQDYFQMQRYLTSYNKQLGLIINFRQHYLRPKRIINSSYKDKNLTS